MAIQTVTVNVTVPPPSPVTVDVDRRPVGPQGPAGPVGPQGPSGDGGDSLLLALWLHAIGAAFEGQNQNSTQCTLSASPSNITNSRDYFVSPIYLPSSCSSFIVVLNSGDTVVFPVVNQLGNLRNFVVSQPGHVPESFFQFLQELIAQGKEYGSIEIPVGSTFGNTYNELLPYRNQLASMYWSFYGAWPEEIPPNSPQADGYVLVPDDGVGMIASSPYIAYVDGDPLQPQVGGTHFGLFHHIAGIWLDLNTRADQINYYVWPNIYTLTGLENYDGGASDRSIMITSFDSGSGAQLFCKYQ